MTRRRLARQAAGRGETAKADGGRAKLRQLQATSFKYSGAQGARYRVQGAGRRVLPYAAQRGVTEQRSILQLVVCSLQLVGCTPLSSGAAAALSQAEEAEDGNDDDDQADDVDDVVHGNLHKKADGGWRKDLASASRQPSVVTPFLLRLSQGKDGRRFRRPSDHTRTARYMPLLLLTGLLEPLACANAASRLLLASFSQDFCASPFWSSQRSLATS